MKQYLPSFGVAAVPLRKALESRVARSKIQKSQITEKVAKPTVSLCQNSLYIRVYFTSIYIKI